MKPTLPGNDDPENKYEIYCLAYIIQPKRVIIKIKVINFRLNKIYFHPKEELITTPGIISVAFNKIVYDRPQDFLSLPSLIRMYIE